MVGFSQMNNVFYCGVNIVNVNVNTPLYRTTGAHVKKFIQRLFYLLLKFDLKTLIFRNGSFKKMLPTDDFYRVFKKTFASFKRKSVSVKIFQIELI